MSFRFFRRFRIAPGLQLNVSRSGPSLSMGPRGAKMTVGPRGTRTTVGIPGTGLHYSKHHGRGGRSERGRSRQGASAGAPPRTGPRNADEEALLDAARVWEAGRIREAIGMLGRIGHLPDAAWSAGMLLLTLEAWQEAVAPLQAAVSAAPALGESLHAIGASVTMSLRITPECELDCPPGEESAVLGLVEALQGAGDPVPAVKLLQERHRAEPRNPLFALSLAELAFDVWKHDERALQEILRVTDGFDNDSAVHAAVLLYRTRVLRELGHLQAARGVIMSATRRTKDRPDALLLALRHERALVHEALGEHAMARDQLERILARDSRYLDVAARLGQPR